MVKRLLLLVWAIEVALLTLLISALPYLYSITDLAIPTAAEAISLTPRYKKELLFPEKRLVALYGTPGLRALGSLGEQDLAASVRRVKKLARQYQPHSKEPVIPAFEIIATVASRSPTGNGDYSAEQDIGLLRRWVDEAGRRGVYVLLDLQPGRTDFLTQAKLYEELLLRPHVGLALDPEWRLKPHQFHLRQIGSVSAGEVNAVADWLADLTQEHDLPQKLLLLHQFKLSMLPDRQRLDTSRPELSYLIQMDGLGSQGAKLGTWTAVLKKAPANAYFGWKNFYDEDLPLRSPADTMKIRPQPWYVSYQ
jgi:hypothetical protein